MRKGRCIFCGCITEFLGSSGHPWGIFNSQSSNEDKCLGLIVAWKHSQGGKACPVAADHNSASNLLTQLHPWTFLRAYPCAHTGTFCLDIQKRLETVYLNREIASRQKKLGGKSGSRIFHFSLIQGGVAVLCGHLDSVYVITVGSNMELNTQHVVRQEHTVYINHFWYTPVIRLVISLQLTVETFPFSIKW